MNNRAVDRILEFAGEAGLVVIFHNDADMPFPRPNQEPYQLAQLKALFSRPPKTSIIWAHAGLGRIVRPVNEHLAMIDRALSAPESKHVNIDISWDEVAKFVVASPEATRATADLINKHSDRFIFGSDVVAPADAQAQIKVIDMYAPLWKLLTPETSRKLREGKFRTALRRRPSPRSRVRSRQRQVDALTGRS